MGVNKRFLIQLPADFTDCRRFFSIQSFVLLYNFFNTPTRYNLRKSAIYAGDLLKDCRIID
jgi:hypothetical protein